MYVQFIYECLPLLTEHAATDDECVVDGGHGMEVLGRGELGQGAVAGGGLADVGIVFPVFPQHHTPVRALMVDFIHISVLC